MTGQRKRSRDVTESARSLAERFLPEPLGNKCVVIPIEGYKWSTINFGLIALFLGMMIGAVVADRLHPGIAFGFAFVVAIGALAIGKHRVHPIEEEFEREAAQALSHSNAG